MSNFLIAFESVMPLFTIMLVGVMIKRYKLLSSSALGELNRMVFIVFFSIMMFYNIYSTDLSSTLKPKLMIFALVSIFIVYGITFFLVCLYTKDNKTRGAMIHAIFRSNFIVMGIPIIGNIFGSSALSLPTMMIAIIVPIYNVLGVFTLQIFRGRRFAIWPIVRGVFLNPMSLGAFIGAIFLALGINIPKPLLIPLKQLTATAAPIALIILGASFKLNSIIGSDRIPLIICIVSRLFIVPAIVLSIAVFLGFRGIELATLVGIFSTPCAMASFAMAQQMNSNASLAGNCVVLTSAISCITVFCWIFFFQTLGML